MMAAVSEVSVVITNRTHYSVALKYNRGDNALVCVAKGLDLIALKIREVAKAYSVPIVESPPLARALHATVDIDQEIPPEHYRAVAEIIGYVMKLRGQADVHRAQSTPMNRTLASGFQRAIRNSDALYKDGQRGFA